MVTRRELIRRCSLPTVAVLAGCYDYPSGRKIDFFHFDIKKRKTTWQVNTTVRAEDNTGRGFQNVMIVGRASNGTVVCRETIGDMSVDERYSEKAITMTCSSFPESIVPVTDESLCEKNTFLEKRVYNDESDGWEIVSIECKSK